MQEWVEQRGTWFVLAFRFMYGFRTITPIMLGANHYPTRRFVVLNTLSGVVWSVVFSLAGWAFGASLSALLRRAGRVEELLLGGLVLAALLALAFRAHARRAERSLGRE